MNLSKLTLNPMTQSFQPVFSYGISHHIVPNCARFGSTDNTEQSQLVVATTTNKIIIHDSEIILNINEKIQALEVTKLFGTYDVIIVGTVSSILVYDAYKNISVFKRDVADGVNCIQVGNFSTYEKLIFCGGNCAIWGFDIEGKDVFWTVTGDNVLSLCLSDIDNDGISELIVGSESFDIRVFKGDLLLYEMTETDSVINLHDFGNGMFAYALLNGTLGMYKGNTRLWRIKSQNEVAALAQFPDAQTVVCAWINGKIEMRDSETGEVKVTESIGDDIAALFVNSENLVVISKDGNVHGFAGQVEEKIIESQQNLLHELNMKKYKILAELKNYERDEMEVEKTTEKETKFLIDTKLESCLQVDSQAKPPCIELQLSASGDALIRAVILFAEGIFNGESYVIHPDEDLTSNMAIQLRPEKDLAVDLHIEAFLGDAHSDELQVFEITRSIPRFVMYSLSAKEGPEPEGKATFQFSEPLLLLRNWIKENFLLTDEIENSDESTLSTRFISLRSNELLIIRMNENKKVTIQSNDMELIGNIIQSMAESFGIPELQITAHFPNEISKLRDLTAKLHDKYIIRDQLSATIAERSNSIKEMLVRMEDARIIKQYGLMRKYCLKLHTLNQAILAEHKVRCNNHEELLQILRNLNKIIEKGARLRVGAPASRLISASRDAILQEDFDMLARIILFGV